MIIVYIISQNGMVVKNIKKNSRTADILLLQTMLLCIVISPRNASKNRQRKKIKNKTSYHPKYTSKHYILKIIRSLFTPIYISIIVV
jgi:hypothetical protein